jgi:hypothetical protein
MKQGHIYRIIHLQSNIQYVGSTFNEPRMRWQQHKQAFKRYMKDGHGCIMIHPHFDEHGIEQFKLLLIKTYEVCDKAHLRAYEQLWINKLSCCNKMNPFRINFLYNKAYRAKNKEHIFKMRKAYRTNNKEEIFQKKKEYRENNKEKIAEQKRKTGSVKVICECGTEIRRDNLGKHKKTKKHLDLVASDSD